MERTDQLPELLRAAAQGDEGAWEQIISRFNGLLWSVTRSYRLGHADAADVVQVTWLRLLQHCDRIRDPDMLGAWLATTARRECLRMLRAASRTQPAPDPLGSGETADPEPLPEATALAAERDELLRQALQALPPHCQRLLGALMSERSPKYAEVSAVLGVPMGSIGPTRGRCLDCLRRHAIRLGLADAA
ncbi:MAG: RNA polymerase sigma factor [Egibacteraceae bacterium]